MYRTHLNGELRIENQGISVTLCGWVQKTRDLGGMTFIDLSDRYGITQLVFNEQVNKTLCNQARSLNREWVIQVTGEVKQRASKNKNICFVQLIAPTTSYERAKKIIKDSHGMVYYISMLSTTGGKLKVCPKKILINYYKIKKINPQKNYVIGFGITQKTISKFKKTDGLVVGSEICKEITYSLNRRQNTVTNVSKLVNRLRKKIL